MLIKTILRYTLVIKITVQAFVKTLQKVSKSI